MKSSPPKKAATARDAPTIIRVYLMVSVLVGQFTFFISILTSFKKTMIFEKIDNFMVLKTASPALWFL